MYGRRAIVTGGASGIGLACARRLVAEGASVVVLDRVIEPSGDDLLRGIHYVACDVRDDESVTEAVAEANRLLSEPADVLINCAGIYRVTPLVSLSTTEWDDVLNTNLRGTGEARRARTRPSSLLASLSLRRTPRRRIGGRLCSAQLRFRSTFGCLRVAGGGGNDRTG